MKKLTKNDKLSEFHKTAQYMMLEKVGQFSMQEIFEDMQEKCDSTVEFGFIKQVILDVLDSLLNKGLIRYYDKNDDGKEVFYESSLTENVKQSV